jgi:hypothetical protein
VRDFSLPRVFACALWEKRKKQLKLPSVGMVNARLTRVLYRKCSGINLSRFICRTTFDRELALYVHRIIYECRGQKTIDTRTKVTHLREDLY